MTNKEHCENELLLHTQDVRGSSPLAPTSPPKEINNFPVPVLRSSTPEAPVITQGAHNSGQVPASPQQAVTIRLTRGYHALIDIEDYERVSAVKWTAHWNGHGWYAINRRSGPLYLHRFILNAPAGIQVDHVNRDGLDCRKANLRLATQSQNNANREKAAGAGSPYKGVDLHHGKWRARAKRDGLQVYLGTFATPEDAARAYNAAALRLHGEFARLNEVRP